MAHITWTYGGKRFVPREAVAKTIIDKIMEQCQTALQPFDDEIESVGGKVFIDISDTLKGKKIYLEDMPGDLVERIMQALR